MVPTPSAPRGTLIWLSRASVPACSGAWPSASSRGATTSTLTPKPLMASTKGDTPSSRASSCTGGCRKCWRMRAVITSSPPLRTCSRYSSSPGQSTDSTPKPMATAWPLACRASDRVLSAGTKAQAQARATTQEARLACRPFCRSNNSITNGISRGMAARTSMVCLLFFCSCHSCLIPR